MTDTPDYHAMLRVAIAEARQGLAEGGIPIGAALFSREGELLGAGHNRRIQENDPSVHFPGGLEWLREHGVEVVDLSSTECIDLLAEYIDNHPAVWNEDIGET